MTTDIIKAYAKVNLALNVKNKRKDGYHNLDMVMSTLELHDVLYISENEDGLVHIDMSKDICNEQDNLCYKIIEFIKKEKEITKGIDIYIEKNIPDGAGLGGGSADAAAMLIYLNKKWDLGYTGKELLNIGTMFGSDIPFCIVKQMSRVMKKGEKIIKLKYQRNDSILILIPDFKLSTKEVFANCNPNKNQKMKIFLNNIKNGSLSGTFNELEQAADKVSGGKILSIIEKCKSLDLPNAFMTGSGSAIIMIMENKKIKETKTIIQNAFPEYKIISTQLKMYTS